MAIEVDNEANFWYVVVFYEVVIDGGELSVFEYSQDMMVKVSVHQYLFFLMTIGFLLLPKEPLFLDRGHPRRYGDILTGFGWEGKGYRYDEVVLGCCQDEA